MLIVTFALACACSFGQEILRVELDLLDDPSCADLEMSSLLSVSIEVVGEDSIGQCSVVTFCTGLTDAQSVEEVEDALAAKQQPLINVPLSGPAEIYVSAYSTVGCTRVDRVLCSQESLNQLVDGVLRLTAQCTSTSSPDVCDYPDLRPCEADANGL